MSEAAEATEPEIEARSRGLFVARLLIGLAQGAALYLLYRAFDDHGWPATDGLVFAPLLLVSLYVPLLLIQGLGEMRLRTLIAWGVAATLLLASLAWYDIWSAWPQDWDYLSSGKFGWRPHVWPSIGLIVFGAAGLFIAHALIAGGDADRRFMARYTTHFDVAWKLAVQLALSFAFVGAFWLLLQLGASLFNLIGLDFFQQLIRHRWFNIPATTLAFAAALHLTDVQPALVRGTRTLALLLLSWMLPLLYLIVGAASYAIGYVIAATPSGAWLKRIETWNFCAALLILAVLLALFSPLADPKRIAVGDQVSRLVDGKVKPETFDFSYLRWSGGRYGRNALSTLAQGSKQAGIREAAAAALKSTSRYDVFASLPTISPRVVVYPKGQALPASFSRQKWQPDVPGESGLPGCMHPGNAVCDAMLVDLDGDGRNEILLIERGKDPRDPLVFHDNGRGQWDVVGSIDMPYQCARAFDSLRRGQFTLVPLPFPAKMIAIGNGRAVFNAFDSPSSACPK